MKLRYVSLLIGSSLLLLPAAAHEDLLGTHYIAPDGVDQGDCRHAHAACLTLSYAKSQTLPGELIKVGAGVYYPTDRELAELFYSPVKLLGGYSAEDGFTTQSADTHPTLLIAGRQWEVAARARGFQFVSSGAGDSEQIGLSVAGAAPATNCIQGSAGAFPCRNIDLLAHIPLANFSSRPVSASDLWGFVDRNDNREYVVIGLANGTAVVDITDPINPREVAFVSGLASLWREPTVYQYFDTTASRYRAYAYVSTEARGGSVQVIDLSGLPTNVALVTQLSDLLSAHTVYVSNVEYAGNTANAGLPAFLSVAGANVNGGSLRLYSLANPAAPTLAAAPVAGYMHDSTSMVVSDARTSQCAAGHNPCEILFDFNENTVDLWDVTNKGAPLRLSTTSYPTARYVHSGWPTNDGRQLFMFDELDELRISGLTTQIYTLDISNLLTPTLRTSYVGATTTTDHNGYVKGDRLYVSHYRRGLVVFDASDPNNLKEVGNLDTFLNPGADVAGTDGAWGAYPFFPSGAIVISDIDNGLFVLRDNTRDLQNRTGRVGFGVQTATVSEAQSEVVIAVRRVDGRQGALNVQYATSAGTAELNGDFQSASGTLSWTDGDDADKSIRIPLVNDAAIESAESFTVTLSGISAPGQIDGNNSLSIDIYDNDAPQPRGSDSVGGDLTFFQVIALASLLAWRNRYRIR